LSEEEFKRNIHERLEKDRKLIVEALNGLLYEIVRLETRLIDELLTFWSETYHSEDDSDMSVTGIFAYMEMLWEIVNLRKNIVETLRKIDEKPLERWIKSE
jgi:hypothetical protein